MHPDDFKQAWQAQTSQTRLTLDAELLLKEVQRNQRSFTAVIFWRDVREVGTSLLLMPVWVFMGFALALPWTWYLTLPGLVWIAAFMLVDRWRHRPQPSEPGEPLRQRVESSLAQVEHQIWLLRNVFWWYLLPVAAPALAFFGQIAWQTRAGGWLTAFAFTGMVSVALSIFGVIYWLNQNAVRCELEPRRQELEALLTSLSDEAPDATRPGNTI